jgi:hypothetical protein
MAEAEAEGRPDLAELYRRTGWTRATPKVRRSLADVADRHTAGYSWVVERIREAPEGERPSAVIRYVLDRDAEDRARWTAEAEAAERQAAEDRQRRDAEAAAFMAEWQTRAGSRPTRAADLLRTVEPDAERRARRVAEWRRAIVGREVPEAAARRAIAEYAPDLDDLAELL